MALLDLDRFKQLNDSSGHLAGDEALRALADVIRREVRRMDWPARVGGDEFGILLPGADIQEEATAVANRPRAAIEEEFADSPLALLASIGVATSSGHETSSQDLLAEADAALYVAKRGGGGHVFAAGWRSTVDEPAREPAGAPAVS